MAHPFLFVAAFRSSLASRSRVSWGSLLACPHVLISTHCMHACPHPNTHPTLPNRGPPSLPAASRGGHEQCRSRQSCTRGSCHNRSRRPSSPLRLFSHVGTTSLGRGHLREGEAGFLVWAMTWLIRGEAFRPAGLDAVGFLAPPGADDVIFLSPVSKDV